MASEPNDRASSDDAASATPGGEPLVNDRVQELTWELVDEQINDDELRLLENLLLSDDQARDTYVGCIQLHTDLLHHYGSLPIAPGGTESTRFPVLGFLNDASLPFGAHPPTAEDSHS